MAATLELVRILIGDTVEDTLTDAEINAIITVETNLYRAASIAALSIAGKYSERVDISSDSSKLSLSQQAKNYRELASMLAGRASTGGDGGTGVAGIIAGSPSITGISIDAITEERQDDDRYQSSFYRGMDDNPPDYSEDYD